MEKKVAIIILTCNQEEILKKCLSSLKKNTNYKNYKVYLMDDSGKGEIGKRIKEKFKWVNLSINKVNIGFSKTINQGIKKIFKEDAPDYILSSNDDIEFIEKDWLKKMVDVAESDKKIGILGCKLIYPGGYLQYFFKNGKIQFLKTKQDVLETKETFQIKELKTMMGACFLIKKEVINEIGLFDEKFSPLYGEETDFCYRAGKKGFKIIYVGNIKLIHHGSASIKNLKHDGGKWFLQKKHGIRFEWLNFDFFNILKHTIMHFGSAILSKNPFEKSRLLIKAYRENIKNLKEISLKRKERNSWEKI
ncbi:glycosyltransferase family 2 protein [Candidatus Pacearchaeota archaeon]|nr:glycosyltransferase family 2 protein [Candidatus Pacearchaeota archaeon]